MPDEGEYLILTLPRADRGTALVKGIPCHYFQCGGNALLEPIAYTGGLTTALFSAMRMRVMHLSAGQGGEVEAGDSCCRISDSKDEWDVIRCHPT